MRIDELVSSTFKLTTSSICLTRMVYVTGKGLGRAYSNIHYGAAGRWGFPKGNDRNATHWVMDIRRV